MRTFLQYVAEFIWVFVLIAVARPRSGARILVFAFLLGVFSVFEFGNGYLKGRESHKYWQR